MALAIRSASFLARMQPVILEETCVRFPVRRDAREFSLGVFVSASQSAGMGVGRLLGLAAGSHFPAPCISTCAINSSISRTEAGTGSSEQMSAEARRLSQSFARDANR